VESEPEGGAATGNVETLAAQLNREAKEERSTGGNASTLAEQMNREAAAEEGR